MKTVSFSRLKELLDYDPETGVFMRDGSVAGYFDGRYRRISIDGVSFYEHRLAWFWMTGEWPKYVDHRNMNRDDNSFSNLRPSTKSLNGANRGKASHNTSGFKGVVFDKRREKWIAQIRLHGKTIHLGRFDSAEVAHRAYVARATIIFGEFARAA